MVCSRTKLLRESCAVALGAGDVNRKSLIERSSLASSIYSPGRM